MKEVIKVGEYKHPWGLDIFTFYRNSAGGCNSRLIDLKIKGLPFDDRQNIFALIDKIGRRLMYNLAEEKDGFPTYRSVGYDLENDIKHQKSLATKRCQNVNDYMVKIGRPPLFTHLDNTYLLSFEYYELMRFQNDDEFAKKYL